ncbi:MAG: hypothetical protein WBV06_00915, partial [Acidimicrobiia bacterium]
EDGSIAQVRAVAVNEHVTVVGGSIAHPDAALYEDGTVRKPVVWISADDGAHWKEVHLDSLDAPDASVTAIAVGDNTFHAIGVLTDRAWGLGGQGLDNSQDLAEWRPSPGDVFSWTVSTLTEPGAQTPYAMVANTSNVYVVGTSSEESAGYRRPVVWESDDTGLVRRKEFSSLEGDVSGIAGAVRIGDRWLVAGTWYPGGDVVSGRANWLLIGQG